MNLQRVAENRKFSRVETKNWIVPMKRWGLRFHGIVADEWERCEAGRVSNNDQIGGPTTVGAQR